ncbi:MAG: hypothetical protein LRY32_02680 [Flavobacterium sp.]|nr:hypothetical protein [Flavobacterium sp.]
MIGTHALIEEDVMFHHLGLVIIDEQHKFGVKTRDELIQKAHAKDVIYLTATPIPRTLAMAAFGESHVSLIKEKPKNRKKVETVYLTRDKSDLVFDQMRRATARKEHCFVVVPAIDSEIVKDNIETMYETLKERFNVPIFTLHGKKNATEQEEAMTSFIMQPGSILLSTTMVEVGIDIPTATHIAIFHAERFGLSQLHQLRGRVGRGAEQSYCILMTSHKLSNDSKIRMETMVRTNDGFEISEVDLKLRGPGDIMGKQQSGVLNLQIADLVKDKEILQLARYHAIKLLKDDAPMEKPEHAKLREAFIELSKKKTIWNYIS